MEVGPAWGPDGRTIAVRRSDTGTYQSGIWLVRADGSGPHRILAGFGNATEPVWSPDGGRLLVEDGQALYSVRPNGGGRRTIVRLSADSKGNLEDPLAGVSPDGRWAVFRQFRPGSVPRSDIWGVGPHGQGRPRVARLWERAANA